ncbi:Alpha/beta hydrolase family protein [Planctomycetes bacterium K2D]|uniref:Alpha/beta hydrolase family protein n=1 Tax=Botrimarina mediterranea TaxID=2528022 RepID=A0A518K8C6_9BACT|nr:Alpha/beta hydrolase family protein [Botrimarina mediterranea]QDV78674.1 Alpha/beta hydrolase family protein [Planctomycetes bacterium K2D]
MAYLKRTLRFPPAPAVKTLWRFCLAGAACLPLAGFAASLATAATIQIKDGRVLVGELGETSGVAEDPLAPNTASGGTNLKSILVVEDGLRRTYLHKTAVREVLDQRGEPTVKIRVWQNDAKRGASLGVIGAPSRVSPFDDHGRRIIELPSDKGPISVIQGVTEVTPVYTRVQGLRAEPRSYIWDMRLATSSLPRETLSTILTGAVAQDDFDQRMQVVRLYLQAERYRDAARELETIRNDFAGRAGVEAEDIDDNLRRLRELASRTLLAEIELRQAAGQHQLARSLLERFPADGVAGDTLQRVRELLDDDDATRDLRADLLDQLERTVEGLQDEATRRVAAIIVAEIKQRLSSASEDRLTAFRQLATGNALGAEELAAVAISGWLLGSNNAVDSLPGALQLVRIRDNMRRYLSTRDAQARDAVFLTLQDAEGAEVSKIAELVARMEPPLPLVDPVDNESESAASPPTTGAVPGYFERFVKVGDREVRWVVQLPPEYDPLRSYPTIVTLGDLGVAPERQLDFWSGGVREGIGRVGQATRHGYVVVAVEWAWSNQLRYGYTAEEHAAVLASLRDAMRRVAIDPDRVFVTGHGAGGDLAWDLALAHPDLWAGALPFLGVADQYCAWYWKNSEFVPWRIVLGELDGDKIARNARELDRYLRPRNDTTVVEYRGRGYDPLSDDLQLAFEWMNRKRRGPPPEEFECFTMRPWDNFFWWIEASGLPEKSMTAPAEWPPDRGVRAASIRGRKFSGNKLGLYTGAEKVTVWLSPELVNFTEPIEIEHNGKRLVARDERVQPDLKTLLEDVRTRADRKRPYWAKVESP